MKSNQSVSAASGWIRIPAIIVVLFLAVMHTEGQNTDEKPQSGKLAGALPYPKRKYEHDREWTGRYFRKLREVREERGNAEAGKQLTQSWKSYQQLRVREKWAPKKAFDDWGFWVWHEAQFDTGKNDPEWSLILFKWIYDTAKADRKFDWMSHVRPQLMRSYGTLCQWANVRALANEAEDYFAGIGFNLDPRKLPAIRKWDACIPSVQVREFPVMVPNSRHVVYWQRYEQKNPAEPIHMDNLLAGLIYQLISEDQGMGEWERALERALWLREWSESVERHNRNKGKTYHLNRESRDTYQLSTLLMVSTLRGLFYKEKPLALVEEALAFAAASKYDKIYHTHLEIERESLLLDDASDHERIIGIADAAIAREKDSRFMSEGSMDPARFLKVRCLKKLNRLAEAEEILNDVCKRRARSLKGWLSAELHLVQLMLDRGDYTKAERTLRELMDLVRVKGVKSEELSLYSCYVRWAMLSGNWEEAMRAQREVMRLLHSFRMTPAMPYEQAVLSRILAMLGNHSESDRLADLAKSGAQGREEFFIKLIENQLGKRPASPVPAAKSRVSMQPQRVMSVALDQFPARMAMTLVNRGTAEARGILRVKGMSAKFTWDAGTGVGTVEPNDTHEHDAGRQSGEIRIAAGAMATFYCSAKLANLEPVTVFLEWIEDGGTDGRCEWVIGVDDKESDGAVIDAAEYQSDPLFMIPIHHHLQSQSREMVNLRVVASMPCRVEMYDAGGMLQMVDALGDGSLGDSGDWLGMDADRNLAAEILPDRKTGETRFLLLLNPFEWKGNEPLSVRVEWLVDGQWFLAAENRIVKK